MWAPGRHSVFSTVNNLVAVHTARRWFPFLLKRGKDSRGLIECCCFRVETRGVVVQCLEMGESETESIGLNCKTCKCCRCFSLLSFYLLRSVDSRGACPVPLLQGRKKRVRARCCVFFSFFFVFSFVVGENVWDSFMRPLMKYGWTDHDVIRRQVKYPRTKSLMNSHLTFIQMNSLGLT